MQTVIYECILKAHVLTREGNKRLQFHDQIAKQVVAKSWCADDALADMDAKMDMYVRCDVTCCIYKSHA